METMELVDRAGVEVEKLKAVSKAIPQPYGRSEEEMQAAALLAVLDDEINLLSETIKELTAELMEGRRSA